jgi:hypothetical protein
MTHARAIGGETLRQSSTAISIVARHSFLSGLIIGLTIVALLLLIA